jgi:hypothetical protein
LEEGIRVKGKALFLFNIQASLIQKNSKMESTVMIVVDDGRRKGRKEVGVGREREREVLVM